MLLFIFSNLYNSKPGYLNEKIRDVTAKFHSDFYVNRSSSKLDTDRFFSSVQTENVLNAGMIAFLQCPIFLLMISLTLSNYP